MRILADVNIQMRTIELLREQGHDVRWGRDRDYSTQDQNLLEQATRDRRILITFDDDFGELVHRDHQPAPFGVLLFRIHIDVPDRVGPAFIANAVTAWDAVPPGIWTIQIRHRSA